VNSQLSALTIRSRRIWVKVEIVHDQGKRYQPSSLNMGWSSIGWASLSSTLVPLLLVSSPKTTRGDVQPSQTLTDIPEMSYVTKSCLAEGDLATFFRGIHYTSAQGRALLQGLNA
ncbi:unnamed protein product, partial [Discosporangium mesarthrocarpum]